MKKILIIFLFFSFKIHAEEFKLNKILDGLNRPWSLSFIDTNKIYCYMKNLEI